MVLDVSPHHRILSMLNVWIATLKHIPNNQLFQTVNALCNNENVAWHRSSDLSNMDINFYAVSSNYETTAALQIKKQSEVPFGIYGPAYQAMWSWLSITSTRWTLGMWLVQHIDSSWRFWSYVWACTRRSLFLLWHYSCIYTGFISKKIIRFAF